MSEDHSRSAPGGGSPFDALAPCPECGGALAETDHTDADGRGTTTVDGVTVWR